MTDDEFRAFLDLMMCSDPWPDKAEFDTGRVLEDLADKEAKRRGYDNWIDAFHLLKRRMP